MRPGERTQEIVTKALTALALRAGSIAKAKQDLENAGIEGVTRDNLKNWSQNLYAEQYNELRDKYARQSEAEMVREVRDSIHKQSYAEALYIQKVIDGYNRPQSAKDASATAFNISRIKAENINKLQTLLGRPTQIIEDRTAEAAIKALIAKRILKPITESSTNGEGHTDLPILTDSTEAEQADDVSG